ncbi:1,2-phenylacetyl-CoA epoxidase subunit PaaC [Priestia megaterium]|uniref:1,2-phenylacetyl-CoA epoxidase subunit PaaC n=1 Tax=Priestia megaterium TaxID=1404 RepID=UPI001126BD0B|nr:1,2-phenylacetyl-CoA epoxidase subunit PaaC [Priestia megaterium]TPF18416.1 phenylacetate-CoA oxygenase subunit PaaI [Priestia megaterium]TPF22526.1 phenylacetate-CoA oxygenase subunit PaaI [Priestia megaterium]
MSHEQVELAPEYKEAITSLLFQLADDDFLFAYRGSEWLGLAPHIEEDVAYSSISQDTMGHAAVYYQLLEELGCGKVDDLAHLRPSSERKNSILVERANGSGTYMERPQYDWAFTVVRNYFYTLAKKVKVNALQHSSYTPIAEIATRIGIELHYHLLHWKTWFVQLLSSTEDAKVRMKQAIDQVAKDTGDLFSLGKYDELLPSANVIDSSTTLRTSWIAELEVVFNSIQLPIPAFSDISLNGRNGEHTPDLDAALSTLREVYAIDPHTLW